MPNENDDPDTAELAKDIQELKDAAPTMYAELEQRVAAKMQAATAKFVNDIRAIPFQTSVQIMLGTGVEHGHLANEVLGVVKQVFRDFDPFHEGPDLDPPHVTSNTLQQHLNEALDDYNLVSRIGPYQLVQGVLPTQGRAGVGVRISAHPRTEGKPNWLEMHFTAFADSTVGAWSALRIRISNLLSV